MYIKYIMKKQQRIIQDLEKDLSMSLMNRLNVYCQIDNSIKCIASSKLKNNVERRLMTNHLANLQFPLKFLEIHEKTLAIALALLTS